MKDLFCCDFMKENTLIQEINDDIRFIKSDKFVYYNVIFNEYGLIIKDGGLSCVLINFCPWCGKKLPPSERDNWFVKLENIGYDNPFEQEIPSNFKTDEWRRNK